MRLILAAAVTLSAAPLFAQAAPRPISRAEFLKANSARFSAIDANKDGKIDRKEMAAGQQRQLAAARLQFQQQFAAKFRQLDTNKNGSLSLAEFQAAMPNISAPPPDQMLAKLDANRNGTVDANEFRAPDLAQFNRADKNKDGVVTPAEASQR